MTDLATRAMSMAGPRVLLLLALALGVLSVQAGRGSLAYFTSTATSGSSVFTSGTLNITSSAIASGSIGTSLTFTTDGNVTSGASCALSGLVGTFLNTQRLTPGVFCTGKLTINNTLSNIDAWLRIRLVRTSGATTGADAALNDKLKFYMNEVGSGDACNSTTFNPTMLTVGIGPVLLGTANAVNAKVIGTGGLGVTQTASGTAELQMTGTTFANLIGNSTIDGILAPGATSATLTAGTSRYFCIAIFFPDAGLPTSNTTEDNAALGGADTYAIHMIAAQTSGRP